jgi:hypothetical protein
MVIIKNMLNAIGISAYIVIIFISLFMGFVFGVGSYFAQSESYNYESPDEFISQNIDFLNKVVEFIYANKIDTINMYDYEVYGKRQRNSDQNFYKEIIEFLKKSHLNRIYIECKPWPECDKKIIVIPVKDEYIFRYISYYVVHADDESDIYDVIKYARWDVKWCRKLQGPWYYCEIKSPPVI